MAEAQSLLRAGRTRDGGAKAIFLLQTEKGIELGRGPVQIEGRVTGAEAEKLRRALHDWIHQGYEPHHAAKAAVMGLDPDATLAPGEAAGPAPGPRRGFWLQTQTDADAPLAPGEARGKRGGLVAFHDPDAPMAPGEARGARGSTRRDADAPMAPGEARGRRGGKAPHDPDAPMAPTGTRGKSPGETLPPTGSTGRPSGETLAPSYAQGALHDAVMGLALSRLRRQVPVQLAGYLAGAARAAAARSSDMGRTTVVDDERPSWEQDLTAWGAFLPQAGFQHVEMLSGDFLSSVKRRAKKIGRGLKAGAKGAIHAAEGILKKIDPRKIHLMKNAMRTLAFRRARYLAWLSSKGKRRTPTPAEVNAQMAWSKSKFAKAGAPTTVPKGGVVKHTTTSGSYARYTIMGRDILSGKVCGIDEVGVESALAWLSPLTWIELLVKKVFSSSAKEAPEQLPEGPPPDEGEPEGEGEAPADEGEAPPDESAGDDDTERGGRRWYAPWSRKKVGAPPDWNDKRLLVAQTWQALYGKYQAAIAKSVGKELFDPNVQQMSAELATKDLKKYNLPTDHIVFAPTGEARVAGDARKPGSRRRPHPSRRPPLESIYEDDDADPDFDPDNVEQPNIYDSDAWSDDADFEKRTLDELDKAAQGEEVTEEDTIVLGQAVAALSKRWRYPMSWFVQRSQLLLSRRGPGRVMKILAAAGLAPAGTPGTPGAGAPGGGPGGGGGGGGGGGKPEGGEGEGEGEGDGEGEGAAPEGAQEEGAAK
jgi:hypothetical protein